MLFFIFCMGSVIGYLMEISYKLFAGQDYSTAGMSKGPFCITYGVASMLLFLLSKIIPDNIFIIFIISTIMLTTLEFISGNILVKIFKITLWDYTSQRFCINKYICGEFMLLWGILGVVFIKIILPIIQSTFDALDSKISFYLCLILSVIMAVDYILVITNQVRTLRAKRRFL
ncbi:MAG: putative ABC transporter permease [Clostridia bacterium]|nr:putative ABC transporter permease [Clostridia bacterium]